MLILKLFKAMHRLSQSAFLAAERKLIKEGRLRMIRQAFHMSAATGPARGLHPASQSDYCELEEVLRRLARPPSVVRVDARADVVERD